MQSQPRMLLGTTAMMQILIASLLMGSVFSATGAAAESVPQDGPLPSVALVGAGRMGVHLAATWASAGVEVTLCARDEAKAEKIVSQLLSGKGFNEGQIKVPRTDATGWKLKAGTYASASDADIVVLSSLPDHTYDIVKALRPHIHGKGKTIVDINNPWIMGSGLPDQGPQSSIEV